MRCGSKRKSVRVVLRFSVGLIVGLFVLGLSNAQDVEASHSHKGRFHKAKSLNCGDMITSHAVLYNDLDCSDYSEGSALTLEEGASLNLNGKKIIGNYDINCIEIRGDDAKVWNGTLTQCDTGIRIRTSRNEIIHVKVIDSAGRGIRIQGDENLLMTCSVANSGRQGIQIDEGNSNKIYRSIIDNSGRHGIQINKGSGNEISRSTVRSSCRDGIEIDEGSNNLVFHNQVEDNGNPETCTEFDEDYNPWAYAGIDVTNGSQENEIKYNRAGCNLGCVATDDDGCIAHERDLWDENVDEYTGQSVTTNRWKSNSIACNNAVPEYSPSPP